MKERMPAFSLRLLLFMGWFLLKTAGLQAQPNYQLFGPTDIDDICRPYTYSLETNVQVLQTVWDLIPSNGSTVTGSSFSANIIFAGPGTYILTATSTTANGGFLSDSLVINVIGSTDLLEVAGCYEYDAKTACYQVCAHSTTTITDPKCGNFEIVGAEEYHFIPPCGVVITWGAGGSGSVYTLSTCPSALCFDILPEPVAGFTTDPPAIQDTITVCKNKSITFTNTSFNGLTYGWDFGDGTSTNTFNASHAYTTEGLFTVILSVQTVCDCHDEKQVVVKVLPEPAPNLDCINTVCPESRQRYTATTDGCTQFTWSVSSNGTIVNGGGPGDDFIEIIWHDGPDGFINLSVANCHTPYCSFSNSFRIPIVTPNGPVTGDASVCSGELTTYTAPYFPGTQYQWQIGPGGNILGGQNSNVISVKWNEVNMVTNSFVGVQYDNCFLECSGSASLNIAITPEITLTADAQVCQDDLATAQATAGFITPLPANVSWHIEDDMGNTVYTEAGLTDVFNHAFTYPPGNYFWVLTNASPAYCTELLRKKIVVTPFPESPLGIIGETIICPGQPAGFTIDAAGNYATHWTITDGAGTFEYDGQTCQHTFGVIPPYVVEAVHSDLQLAGCNSVPVSITLNTIAVYSISGPDTVCLNGIDDFSLPYVSGADYDWQVIPADHGTIKRSDLNQVKVFWKQSGPCTLRLQSCGSVIDKTIFVQPLPVFHLVGPLAACSNEQVSLSTDQPLLDHVWKNENDLGIGLQNNIALMPGSYAVVLTDMYGCSSDQSFTISSYPSPVVHVSSTADDTYCSNIPGGVNIVANTDGSDYAFLWYQDGVSTGVTGPVYNVTDFASYHVEVTNQYGCKAVSPDITYLNCCTPPCDGGGGGGSGLPVGCNYINYDFDIEKTAPECNTHIFTPHDPLIIPGQTQWLIRSISEGYIGNITTDVLNYTYDLPGYYFITLVSTLTGYPYTASLCGHIEELIDTVRAVADFKQEGHCVNANISFEDLTTFLPGENIAGWSWVFDDPASGADNFSSLQDPVHVFSSAGDYQVTLTVALVSGCQASKTTSVHISDGPVLNPVYDPVYCEDEALSVELPGNVFEVSWDFGDPGSGIQDTAKADAVLHTFDLPGQYTVKVAAADIFMCRSETSFSMDINPNTMNGFISVLPGTALCFGDTATLISPPVGDSWLWSTGETTPQIMTATTGQYNVLIEDAFHCTYTPPSVFVAITPKPDLAIKAREILGPDEFGPWENELHVCQGTEFELSGFSSVSGVLFQWSDGSTSQVIQFTDEGGNLPNSGIYNFTLLVIDPLSGCISDTSTIMVEIYDLPQLPLIALTGGSGCSFDLNTLQVTNPEIGVQYTWSDGQTGSTISTQKAGPYFVTAINDHGCSELSAQLIINASAPVDQIPGGCHIECDPLTVCLPLIYNVANWSIFQNGVLYDSGLIWPSDYQITTDGSYTIEVTTTNGCTATSDPLDITLYPGVGSVTVLTYLDVDHDGMITAADMLLSGIPVEILSEDGLQSGMTYTQANGEFVFEDYPTNGYTAFFNPLLLSSQWRIVIDSVQAAIQNCDDSVVVALLLEENCIVSGPDVLIESCPGEQVMIGDSIWSDTGEYVLHLMSAAGCDSVFTLHIQWPDSIEIGATVWVDVDQNGIVSPADTVIQGVTIVIDPVINHSPYTVMTDVNGNIIGAYPSGHYLIAIDSTLLPPGLSLGYGAGEVQDTICGMAFFDFLLIPGCVDVFLVQTEEICEGDSILVQGEWITTGGMYTYLLSQPGSGCDTMLDVYLTVTPGPVLNPVIEWDCIHQGSIDLSVTGIMPFQYLWNPVVPGDAMLTGLPDGVYGVTIVDANGCLTTDSFLVQSPPPLNFDLPGYYEITQGDSVLIRLTGNTDENGLTFQWWPPAFLSCPTCPSTWAFPDTNTVYTVTISSTDSCKYEFQTFLQVNFDSSTFDRLYIPNVFSPNGDGINDLWRMYSRLDNTFVNSITIFDRWGELLFHKENFNLQSFDGWDGTFRGRPMQPGVFAYTAEIILGDGTTHRYKGNITLVR